MIELIPPHLLAYIHETVIKETPVQQSLRARTAEMPEARMQVSPDQGQFLSLLARIIGARRILEIGTFTGYSALAFARALPEGGRLVCCDLHEEWTAMAREAWEAEGVADRIELRIGPASESLAALRREGASFDFAFIDADKVNYDDYYEQCLHLVRPGGLIVLDNLLWSGRVADHAINDPDTAALKVLNAKLGRDERIDFALLPIRDGIGIARIH